MFPVVVILSAIVRGVLSDESKIQGGEQIDIKKWPYLGSYVTDFFGFDQHQCMTMLVKPGLALTAAHCIIINECVDPETGMVEIPEENDDMDRMEAYIVMGTNIPRRKMDRFYQRIRIARAHIHEKFQPIVSDPFITAYDIAAPTMKKPFILTSRVALAPVYPTPDPDTTATLQQFSNCKIAGWGYRDAREPKEWSKGNDWRDLVFEHGLDEMKVSLMSMEECCARWPYFTEDFGGDCMERITLTGHSCAERVVLGNSPGHGDSGTAFECDFNGKVRKVVGMLIGGDTPLDPDIRQFNITIAHPIYRVRLDVLVPFAREMGVREFATYSTTKPPRTTHPTHDELK